MSLDDITTVKLNTDVLKHNFEIIIEILKGLAFKVHGNMENSNMNTELLKDLMKQITVVEKKQESDKKEIDNRIDDTDKNVKDVKDHTNRNTEEIANILDQLKDLKDNNNTLKDRNACDFGIIFSPWWCLEIKRKDPIAW